MALPPQGTKTVVHRGKFIKFLKQDGWEFVERVNCSGIVIIVPLTQDKKVILTEQYRLPVGKNVIEYPAGLVNDRKKKRKESNVTAAKRELFEETGYRASKMVKITEGPISSGLTVDCYSIYIACGLKKAGLGGGDDLEDIAVHEIPIKTIDGWLKKKERSGCLIDPKIYAGLYLLRKYNSNSV